MASRRAKNAPFFDTVPPVTENLATSGSSAPSRRAEGDAPDRRVWIDGVLRPWADATIHVLSHSLQRGSLVFDYMSVHPRSETGVGSHGDFIFRMREHIERFLRSCELMGLPIERAGSQCWSSHQSVMLYAKAM